MCGIAGIVSKDFIDSPILIKLMTDKLKHRGPDDEGFLALNFFEKVPYILVGKDSCLEGVRIEDFKNKVNILLGHRRLSIIDISPAGHQPMSDDAGKLWIVYNGEIYNYVELRDELKRLGYSFKTNSDTEVILKAYAEWGVDCVKKFNGMWSFALIDLNQDILFASRDIAGVKPFYYYYEPGKTFVFASEVKAFYPLKKVSLTVDETKIFDFLAFNKLEEDDSTFFREIKELPPRHSLIISLRDLQLKIFRYIDIYCNLSHENFDERKLDFYRNKLREAIFRAVKQRLRSDVAVGSCLSGGIDSSTIVMVINEILKSEKIEQIGERQKVFTAIFTGEEVDESKWANLVVQLSNATWYTTNPNFEDLIRDIEDLVYYQDFPFQSTSIYAGYRVMKLVKESGVKVTLDGQGSDELFGGYHPYYTHFFKELVLNKDLKTFFSELFFFRSTPMNSRQYFLRLLAVFSESAPFAKSAFINQLGSKDYLKKEYWRSYSDRLKNHFEERTSIKSLNQGLKIFFEKWSLKILLRYADRNSMRFSVESRFPFSDDIDLVILAFQIPSVYKIRRGLSKYILRESIKGLIPEEIRLRRDKIGFQTPEIKWFRNNRIVISSFLRDHQSSLLPYVNIERLIKDVAKDKREVFPVIWRFLNLALWLETVRREIQQRV